MRRGLFFCLLYIYTNEILHSHPSLPPSLPPVNLPVSVNVFNNDDFPTEGKPIKATLPSPLRATSNPVPAAPGPLLLVSSKSSERSLARRALSAPRWCSVALFFWVRDISSCEGAEGEGGREGGRDGVRVWGLESWRMDCSRKLTKCCVVFLVVVEMLAYLSLSSLPTYPPSVPPSLPTSISLMRSTIPIIA